MIAVLLLGPAPPASAHEPNRIRNLHPSHYNGRSVGGSHYRADRPADEQADRSHTNEAQIASDAFDGVDTVLTLRAAAPATARYYEWHLCTEAESGWTIWNPPEPCDLIATDLTPTLSFPAPGVEQIAVFEAPFDIPQDYAREYRTAACIDGPPSGSLPDPDEHCRTDHIRSIHFDDGPSGFTHPSTTAGQITQPVHGGAVANAGFTAVAFTSADDIGRLQFCLTHGTPFRGPGEDASPRFNCHAGSVRDTVPNDSPSCVTVPPGAHCWEAVINPPDDAEFLLGIVEQDDPTAPLVSSGAGDCEGDTDINTSTGGDGVLDGDDCQLDKIYVTSVQSPPQPPDPQPGPGPQPGSGPQPGPGPQPGGPRNSCPGFRDDPRNQIIGTTAADELVGSPGADIICGGSKRDVIRGRGGKDLLLGGPGNDRMRGGPGRDRCRGGPGRDTESGCEG